MNTIDFLEFEQMKKNITPFKVGDSVKVHVKIVEGDKQRIQVFQGVVIGRQNGGHARVIHGPQDLQRHRRREGLPAALAHP